MPEEQDSRPDFENLIAHKLSILVKIKCYLSRTRSCRGELQAWVHNRLKRIGFSVTAQCASHGATVLVEGGILHLKKERYSNTCNLVY